jgi:hypothetical protein
MKAEKSTTVTTGSLTKVESAKALPRSAAHRRFCRLRLKALQIGGTSAVDRTPPQAPTERQTESDVRGCLSRSGIFRQLARFPRWHFECRIIAPVRAIFRRPVGHEIASSRSRPTDANWQHIGTCLKSMGQFTKLTILIIEVAARVCTICMGKKRKRLAFCAAQSHIVAVR